MPRTPLDRDRIVAVALDLLDEVGLDHLSTRALADRLGVRSPALYWHFANKQELVEAMAEAMMLQLPADPGPAVAARRPSRASVAVDMVERAQRFRAVLLSRRDGARVHAGSRPPTSRLGTVESQIGLLCRLGLDPLDAGRVTLAVSRFVVGWVLEEQQDRQRAAPPFDLTGYPNLAAASRLLEPGGADDSFDACVAAVVGGLLRRPTG